MHRFLGGCAAFPTFNICYESMTIHIYCATTLSSHFTILVIVSRTMYGMLLPLSCYISLLLTSLLIQKECYWIIPWLLTNTTINQMYEKNRLIIQMSWITTTSINEMSDTNTEHMLCQKLVIMWLSWNCKKRKKEKNLRLFLEWNSKGFTLNLPCHS